MNEQNDESKPVNNTELSKEKEPACGCGCSCNTEGSSGRMRCIVGFIVIVAAAALVARAMVKSKGAQVAKTSGEFATLSAPNTAATPSDAIAVKEIGALSDLNTVANDMAGVFVFVPEKNETGVKMPAAQIQRAVKTIEPKAGGKIGVFALKTGSLDYQQVAAQMEVPGVIAMIKGRGMVPVTGEITEAKLVQAFVAASSASGCGTGGCGPSGCK